MRERALQTNLAGMAARGRRHPILWVLLVCVSLPMMAYGQQAEDLGSFEVHYSAINTSQLTPEVARAIGVQRSSSRGLLNLAVLRKQDGQMNEAIPARIRVEAVNLVGQRREVALNEVREEDAIYYLGTFRFHNEERVTFHVEVEPLDRPGTARQFRFQQQFFVY